MKIVMMTDLEGVAGVVSFESDTYATGKYYENSKRLLTGEVNAAVEGLYEAGATEVLVLDGHGSGGIVYEEIHPRALLLHGRPVAYNWPYAHLAEYDAAIMVGQHAMAGVVDGDLHHTQNSRSVESYTLNGQAIGEIGQFVLGCGAQGVPMIFLSGDEAACREVEELVPGIVTAAVKKGINRTSAVSVSKEESRRRIREGAATALSLHMEKPVEPLVWPGPYVLEKRFFTTTQAEAFDRNPAYEKVDPRTVRIQSDRLLDIIYG